MDRRLHPFATALFLAVVGQTAVHPAAAAGGQTPPICQPAWQTTFGSGPGVSDAVRALVSFDDGTGTAVYVGGAFLRAGSVQLNRVGRWDGAGWSPLARGLDGEVRAMAVFDDGSGPALFVGGDFTNASGQPANNVAKWNGSTWSNVGGGVAGSSVGNVRALAVFDDGTGAALYAGGHFTSAGGSPANRIAKWTGTTWAALGDGTAGGVEALAVWDDGTGPALFVGGVFTSVDGLAVHNMAKWSGTSWSPLGTGVAMIVETLAVHDDGTGAQLYAGGSPWGWFGFPADNIARWNGQAWSQVGAGLPEHVHSLTTLTGGLGGELCAGTWDNGPTGTGSLALNRWDGHTWSVLSAATPKPSGVTSVDALHVHDFGLGSRLVVGGDYIGIGDTPFASHVAEWDGSTWSALGNGVSSRVSALLNRKDDTGSTLYVGGAFTHVAGLGGTGGVATWDGESWSSLGGGVDGGVAAIALYDSGSGPEVYVGGSFSSSGGVQGTARLARWDGVHWKPVGGGPDASVAAMTTMDDGSGEALFVAGFFSSVGGVAGTSQIARWNGAVWTPLATGISGIGGVRCLEEYDAGSGPMLVAGGNFVAAGGVPANRVAMWDGTSWQPMGAGLNGPVLALKTYDDGQGPRLYAGGGFNARTGTMGPRGVARWDGSTWVGLGTGLSGPIPGVAHCLEVYDDGFGPALYAGGNFYSAGSVAAHRIAKWDGVAWSALGSGAPHDNALAAILALSPFDDGNQKLLFIAGDFSTSPGGDAYLTSWGGCAPSDAPGAFTAVTGCVGNGATLEAEVPGLHIGQALSFRLSAGSHPDGVAVLCAGWIARDSGGCGLFLPLTGELLLHPGGPMLQLQVANLSAGSANFRLEVPTSPGLLGVALGFQAAQFEPLSLWPAELSNALTATVAP